MYSSCYQDERKQQWQTIADMGRHMDLPWIIIGDLNVTLSCHDRNSFSTHASYTPEIIQDTIQQFGLMEIPFMGHPFTWSNRRKNLQLVQTRLDRALASHLWFSLFPDAIINHLIPLGSDHAPILLSTAPPSLKTYKPFRLYETWTKHDTFRDLIKHEWEKVQFGSSSMQFTKKIQHLRRGISNWKKLHFGNIYDHITAVQQQIKEAQTHSNTCTTEVSKLQQDLQHWYNVKAEINYQHSRYKLLRCQDRNTKAFHDQANYRRRRNQIDSIKDDKGNWYTSINDIQRLLIKNFSNITTSCHPPQDADIFHLLSPCISLQEN
ncbi:hypothetical protein MKX03_020937 [Papaver bracteatum]|nr:hypothetical protein MKX03_020937 [Papaver bracteatum]